MSTRTTAATKRARVRAQSQAVQAAAGFLQALAGQMDAAGMSNAELARRLGVSPAYVSKLMRGPANLSLATLAKLAQAVDCTLDLRLVSQGQGQ